MIRMNIQQLFFFFNTVTTFGAAESEREYKRGKANKGVHLELRPNVSIKTPYASIIVRAFADKHN